MAEEWSQIPGFEGIYDVSSDGAIRRVAPKKGGPKRNTDEIRWVITKGYAQASLSRPGGVKHFKVHQIVAMTFIGPCPEGLEINHRDGNKLNNNVANLEYVTRRENMRHAYQDIGAPHIFGEAHHAARATSAQVAEAREMLARGVSKKNVAKKFGHHLSWAYQISHGQTRANG